MSDILKASLAQIRKLLADRGVSAAEVVRASLERVAETEPSLRAMITVREQALEEAEALDAEGPSPDRPLWGVPVAVKDVIALKGTRTTAGSKILENFVPFYDAFVVERLKAAGAVVVGKTNLDEFAMGSSTENSAFWPTSNPRDLSRVPGGSSGGSAASVTACQCYAALGTDTGGSIRQPASLCGCVGLKPTYGRVSRYGVVAYGSSLDQVGPLTRTVEDAGIVLSVIAGHDRRDSTSSPRPVDVYTDFSRKDLKGARLGVPREFMEAEGLDGAVAEVCGRAFAKAEALGAELVDVSLPHATRHAVAAYYIVAMAEASSNLSRFDGVRYGRRAEAPGSVDDLYVRSRTEGFGAEVQRRILLGTYVLSAGYYDAYYRKAAQVRRLVREDYLAALERCDAIFCPVSPVTAWKKGAIIDDPLKMYLMDIYTVSLNLAGLPGLSFPAGLADGLPVGMQLVGRDFDEAGVLSLGNLLCDGDVGF